MPTPDETAFNNSVLGRAQRALYPGGPQAGMTMNAGPPVLNEVPAPGSPAMNAPAPLPGSPAMSPQKPPSMNLWDLVAGGRPNQAYPGPAPTPYAR